MLGRIQNIANQFSRRVSPSFPQGLLDAAQTQRNAHLDANGQPKLTRISDGRELDLGNTTKQMIPPGSQSQFIRQLTSRPDAGNAIVLPDNATISTLRYTYGSHKPMEAWVNERPPNGKLVLNMLISPSIHAGSDRESKLENYKKFGKENVYNMEVLYPDGTSERVKFDVNGDKDPARGYESDTFRAATLGPDLEIDVDKWKGQDVKIRGWADGSAGVMGYQERRETILHL